MPTAMPIPRPAQIVDDVGTTWGATWPKLYYHVDRTAAAAHFAISRGRWGISNNLKAGGGKGKGAPHKDRQDDASPEPGKAIHRVCALNLPERPNTAGEHWTVSHDKGMNWNTWLRYTMRSIFECAPRYSPRLPPRLPPR